MCPTHSSVNDDHNAQLSGTNTPLRDPAQPGGGKAPPRNSGAAAADAGKPRGQRLSAGDRDTRRDEDENDRGNR